MKLELKAIKHTEWASQETHCYQANLYVNGKPVAIVSNDGHGGCDRECPHPKFKGDYRATMNAVNDYFKSLPKTDACEWMPNGMEQTLEFWCSDQINDWLSARDLKRKMKSYVLVQLKGRNYHAYNQARWGIYQTKWHPTVTKGEWITNKQSGETRRILNDMPFDKALAIWKES